MKFILKKAHYFLYYYSRDLLRFPIVVVRSLLKSEPHVIDFYTKRVLLKGAGFYQHKSKITKESTKKVNIIAEQTIGPDNEEYSGATAPEVAHGFETCIIDLKKKFQSISYLEIGSAKGKSMGLIGLISLAHNMDFSGTSIDPYFKDAYEEGADQPVNFVRGKTVYKAPINSSHRKDAINLWQNLKLNVEQLKKISSIGLVDLAKEKKNYNLIYIDGLHDGFTPVSDFFRCLDLITNNGIIILDDRHWANVHYLRKICDNTKGLHKIFENWKITCYEIDKDILVY